MLLSATIKHALYNCCAINHLALYELRSHSHALGLRRVLKIVGDKLHMCGSVKKCATVNMHTYRYIHAYMHI